MKTKSIPNEIKEWIKANADKVDDYWLENDGMGGDAEPWSIWLYLKEGWINEAVEAHLIHECTVENFMNMTAYIIPCTCADCTSPE